MNRKKDIAQTISKSFIEAVGKMSKEDELAIYQSISDGDFEGANRIFKKNNYKIVTPIERTLSDAESEELANKFLSDGLDKYFQMNQVTDSMVREYWSKSERVSAISLEKHHEVLQRAQELQSSFYSKNSAIEILESIHGENAVTLIKAALIADLVGCLEIRNDLMSLFNCMQENAIASKAINLYKRKKVISEDRSKAKKGKRNRHYDKVLDIARDTWKLYPNASVSGMGEEIWLHLRKDWNDTPAIGTIQEWLKNSGITTDVDPSNRNRDFKLIL